MLDDGGNGCSVADRGDSTSSTGGGGHTGTCGCDGGGGSGRAWWPWGLLNHRLNPDLDNFMFQASLM
jgi:hypothetical protein